MAQTKEKGSSELTIEKEEGQGLPVSLMLS